jgi:hypothetical protein
MGGGQKKAERKKKDKEKQKSQPRKPGTAVRYEKGKTIAEICEYEACKDHEFPVSDARRAVVNFVSLPIRQTLYASKL